MSSLSVESILNLMTTSEITSNSHNEFPNKSDIFLKDILEGVRMKREIFLEGYLGSIGDLSRIMEGETLTFEKNRFRVLLKESCKY